MKHNNISSWAEDFGYEDLTEEAGKYNLPLGLLEDACDVLTRSNRNNRKERFNRCPKESWQ